MHTININKTKNRQITRKNQAMHIICISHANLSNGRKTYKISFLINIPVNFEALYLCDTLLHCCECKQGLSISDSKSKSRENWSHDSILGRANKIEDTNMMYTERYLVEVKLHIYQRHSLIHFIVVSDHPMDSLGNILKYQVEIKLIFFSSRKEAMLQRYNIRVVEKAHSLQFPILVSLILKDLLYSHCFTSLQALCL